MCRIMVSWGLVSMATMFVTGPRSFYVLRLLLGIAEAGFFPGVILYLSYWFPNRVKGRILGLFYFGAPLAFIFGGPLSGVLLDMPARAGLQGWQWMFLSEGFLAVAVGIWAYLYLGDKPADASWLPDTEKQALLTVLQEEEQARRTYGSSAFPAVLMDWRVLHYVLIYFLIQMSVYGVVFLPANRGCDTPGQIRGDRSWVRIGNSLGLRHSGYVLDTSSGRQAPKSPFSRRSCPGGLRLGERSFPNKRAGGRATCLVRCSIGFHRCPTFVLDFSHGLSRRYSGCGRHRVYQCDGGPGRIFCAQRKSMGRCPLRISSRWTVSVGWPHAGKCGADCLRSPAQIAPDEPTFAFNLNVPICVGKPLQRFEFTRMTFTPDPWITLRSS